ncbi:MAG: hypothetical protein HUU06_12445, partial [Planctomycetaceae bacterium]|nr:hypothetical protein [Planctomycetaceae bacterium]
MSAEKRSSMSSSDSNVGQNKCSALKYELGVPFARAARTFNASTCFAIWIANARVT